LDAYKQFYFDIGCSESNPKLVLLPDVYVQKETTSLESCESLDPGHHSSTSNCIKMMKSHCLAESIVPPGLLRDPDKSDVAVQLLRYSMKRSEFASPSMHLSEHHMKRQTSRGSFTHQRKNRLAKGFLSDPCTMTYLLTPAARDKGPPSSSK
jgi:hypothetical protein